MTEHKLRLAVILDNEVLESWDMNDLDIYSPMYWSVLVNQIRNKIRNIKDALDAQD